VALAMLLAIARNGAAMATATAHASVLRAIWIKLNLSLLSLRCSVKMDGLRWIAANCCFVYICVGAAMDGSHYL
jgi:hypothetical protein